MLDPDRHKAWTRTRQGVVTLQLHGVPHLQPRTQLFAQLSVQPCEATKVKLDLLRHSAQQSIYSLLQQLERMLYCNTTCLAFLHVRHVWVLEKQ